MPINVTPPVGQTSTLGKAPAAGQGYLPPTPSAVPSAKKFSSSTPYASSLVARPSALPQPIIAQTQQQCLDLLKAKVLTLKQAAACSRCVTRSTPHYYDASKPEGSRCYEYGAAKGSMAGLSGQDAPCDCQSWSLLGTVAVLAGVVWFLRR